MFSRRILHAQHPVSLRTSIPDANSVILRAHLCTAVGSMLKTLCSKVFMRRARRSIIYTCTTGIFSRTLCVESCVIEEFHISPRFSPSFFHRDAMCCTSFVSIICVRPVRSAMGEYSVLMFGWNILYCCLPNANTTKRNIRHISDWSKCTVFYTPEPKLMQRTD